MRNRVANFMVELEMWRENACSRYKQDFDRKSLNRVANFIHSGTDIGERIGCWKKYNGGNKVLGVLSGLHIKGTDR